MKLLASTKGSLTTASPGIGDPDWEDVSLLNLQDLGIVGFQEFVRIPLKNYHVNQSYTAKMYPLGYRDLLMRKNGDDNFILNIIEIHPDSLYLSTRRKLEGNEHKTMRELIKNEDFTGYFLVYSPETNYLIFGERRENGIPVSRIKIQ